MRFARIRADGRIIGQYDHEAHADLNCQAGDHVREVQAGVTALTHVWDFEAGAWAELDEPLALGRDAAIAAAGYQRRRLEAYQREIETNEQFEAFTDLVAELIALFPTLQATKARAILARVQAIKAAHPKPPT